MTNHIYTTKSAAEKTNQWQEQRKQGSRSIPQEIQIKGGYTFLKKLFTIVKAKIYTPCLERSFISNIFIFSFYLSEGYYQYRF
jgi:hypothetical protein